jgi:hypothetical protein
MNIEMGIVRTFQDMHGFLMINLKMKRRVIGATSLVKLA